MWPSALMLQTQTLVIVNQRPHPGGLDADGGDSEEKHPPMLKGKTHMHTHTRTHTCTHSPGLPRQAEAGGERENVRLERPEQGKRDGGQTGEGDEGQKGLKASGTPAKAKPKGLGRQGSVVRHEAWAGRRSLPCL